jgi:hypothetical protein
MYVLKISQKDFLSPNVLYLRTFCLRGRLVFRTFCLRGVWSSGRFVSLDVLSFRAFSPYGRFDPRIMSPDVFLRTFLVPPDVLSPDVLTRHPKNREFYLDFKMKIYLSEKCLLPKR